MQMSTETHSYKLHGMTGTYWKILMLHLCYMENNIIGNPKQRFIYSWVEAEEYCIRKHGGHLPSFSSQSDVDDLIDILLRATWTGPIRMIYIGLMVRTIHSNCIVLNKTI